MVHQSELPFRTLCRKHGVDLCYTPMVRAVELLESVEALGIEKGLSEHLQTTSEDRPLVVQLSSNKADELLAAALIMEPHCDAIDLNLG